MIIQKNIEFLKGMSTPTVSRTFPNSAGDILAIQISGDFGGAVRIEGRSRHNGDWVSLAGISLKDFSVARDGFTSAGLYEIGIVGVREIRARIDEVTGNVALSGQIISTEET